MNEKARSGTRTIPLQRALCSRKSSKLQAPSSIKTSSARLQKGALRGLFWTTRVAAIICVCVLCATVAHSTAPAVYPKRVINGYAVDLLPLFVWWDHQDRHGGVRPLAS